MTEVQKHLGSDRFERGHGQCVLAVEVGGEGQDAMGLQAVQGVFQQPIPLRSVMPEILVSDEDEVEARELFHPVGD